MEENEARKVVDGLRERGVDAHMEKAGVYQFGVRIMLPDGRQAVWDSDGTAALEAQVMRDGMLVGFVPQIEGSADYDVAQTVDVILRTDYDQPVARQRATAPPPARRCPGRAGCSAASSAASGKLRSAPGGVTGPLTPLEPGARSHRTGSGRGRHAPSGGVDDHPASTGVACSPTITHISTSSSRLQPITLRKMSPSRPAMPTAAAAIARFCGLTILPSTPPEEFAAAISTGSSPALAAVCTCRAPNSAFDEVSEPVTATPIQPRIGERIANDAAGAGQPGAERGGLAGQVHHVGQRQHRHHGDDRGAQLDVGLARTRASARAGRHLEDHRGDEPGDDHQRAGGGQPVERERASTTPGRRAALSDVQPRPVEGVGPRLLGQGRP